MILFCIHLHTFLLTLLFILKTIAFVLVWYFMNISNFSYPMLYCIDVLVKFQKSKVTSVDQLRSKTRLTVSELCTIIQQHWKRLPYLLHSILSVFKLTKSLHMDHSKIKKIKFTFLSNLNSFDNKCFI